MIGPFDRAQDKRKNWLFFETSAGADSSAIIYSLIESAKLAGLKPFDYLLFLFEKLPYAVTEEDLVALASVQPHARADQAAEIVRW